MMLRVLAAIALALAIAGLSTAQPGIAIEGSGIGGTEVQVHLSGDPGEFFLLYLGLLGQPTDSWTGQKLGIGPSPIPIWAGRFDASGQATYKFPVPDVPELAGKIMAFFQFETFEVVLFPPSFKPKNVSPGAYFVLAPAGSGEPTRFGVDRTNSQVGSTVALSCQGQPGDFILAYWGTSAVPLLLPDGTNVGVVPPLPFTTLTDRMDAQGLFVTRFPIPDEPALVGTNVCMQFQTYAIQLFPPAINLKDSSCCLLFTIKPKA